MTGHTTRHREVARALETLGVDTLFGVMGVGNLDVVTDLTADGVRYVSARNETGAVTMADGYARVSGRLGVATVTQGPGLTNTITALTTAVRHGTPLLLVTGAPPDGAIAFGQVIDLDPVITGVGARPWRLGPEDDWYATTLAAARGVLEEGRPAVLQLPADLLREEVAVSTVVTEGSVGARAAVEPDGTSTRDLVEMLEGFERPLVLVGRGVDPADLPAVEALADHVGALVGTTLLAKSAMDHHPYDVGIVGGFAHPLARRLLGDVDGVVAFGASLNPWTLARGTLFREARIVHVDRDPAAIGRFVQPSLGLVGDAGLVATAALEAAGPARPGWRTDDIRERLAGRDPWADFVDESEPGRLDPRAVACLVDDVLPRERTLVLDAGHYVGFPASAVRLPDPRALVFTMSFGAVGMGMGAAIGAAVGAPDRHTIAVLGDGGLMMGLADLETAARQEIPMTILVMNDGAYGAEIHHLRHAGLSEDAARFTTPPLDEVACSLGLRGRRAATLDELADVLGERVRDPTAPLLVDVPINGDILSTWYAEVLGA